MKKVPGKTEHNSLFFKKMNASYSCNTSAIPFPGSSYPWGFINELDKEAGLENPAGVHHENGVKWKDLNALYMISYFTSKKVCV